MEKQKEYDIRMFVSNLIDSNINKEFDYIMSKYDEYSKYELICYSLLSMENGFKQSTFSKDTTYSYAGNKRTILEWFIKKLIGESIQSHKFTYDNNKYDKFDGILGEIFILCRNDLMNRQFKQHRGINKILIEENEAKEIIFKVPTIVDELDCQDTYYWGEFTDNNSVELERRLKNAVTERILSKYFNEPHTLEKDKSMKDFIFMNEVDFEIYELCKQNIKVDIDKIGCNFKSDLFNNSQELIDIISVFFYLSKINSFKDSILDAGGSVLYKTLTIYTKSMLRNIFEKFNISDSIKVNKFIDYFTIKNECSWGINEFPLINIDDNIIWVPSSFIMNDFQFSIVNGHYDKKISVINRDDTVSQSIVDNIINRCSKYDNIVISENKEYFDKNHKYKDEDLKSDIDVSLYDKISNTMIVIECKWKENIYIKGNKYDKICDAVDKIYKNQLNKHKYFLELEEKNIEYIFDNNINVINRPYFPQIEYIFVDKRVQLHYNNQHALSEFNLLKLIIESSYNNILRIDTLISKIKRLQTEVKYNMMDTKTEIDFNGTKIKNSIFLIK